METGEMLGGLYKKSKYLLDYQNIHGRVITVDSGDLLNDSINIKESILPLARLKGDLIARIYRDINIDAINVGELDLALSLDFLKRLEKQYDLPFVSANLVDEAGRPIFKRYVIKNVDGRRIGIFGLMGDDTDMVAKLKEVAHNKIGVLGTVESAESVVRELDGKTDFIIALTHQHMGRNWVIARKVAGIDVIVGGHHKQKTKDPYLAEKTFIVQSGEKGQYQGMLEITFNSDGTRTAKNNLVPLGPNITDDTWVKSMIDQYNDNVKTLYSANNKVGLELPLSALACKTCHAEAFSIWQASDHARAFETLVKKSRQFNPECLACHTTRFDQPGGFTMELQQGELRSVQCDACHGDSTQHLNNGESMPGSNLSKEFCIKCHTPEQCPDFEKDFQKEWEKIRH